MKRYYCDVCGEELPQDYKPCETIETNSPQDLCGVVDVCGPCKSVEKGVSVREAILKAWRNAFCEEPKAMCWCKDCQYYDYDDSEDEQVCTNSESTWNGETIDDYGSCQHCKPKEDNHA